MNWHVKAFIQKVLALSRFGDKLNHRLVTFDKNYHENVVTYQSHETLRKFSCTDLNLNKRLVALEIGTGYSLVSAVTLALLGFDKIVTVDITPDISFSNFKKQIGHFLKDDIAIKVREKSKYSETELTQKIKLINEQSSFDGVFKILNIIYIAPYSFEEIEKVTGRVDHITSQVVLEHVPPEILEALFKKTKQWLSPDGYCVHTINFIDHFANPGFFQDKSTSEFNFLKYSDKHWRSWAGNSIAYTNRLSYLFYLELAEKHKIKVVDFIGENYRDRVELPLTPIHEDVLEKYNQKPDRELLTKFQRGTLILKVIRISSAQCTISLLQRIGSSHYVAPFQLPNRITEILAAQNI